MSGIKIMDTGTTMDVYFLRWDLSSYQLTGKAPSDQKWTSKLPLNHPDPWNIRLKSWSHPAQINSFLSNLRLFLCSPIEIEAKRHNLINKLKFGELALLGSPEVLESRKPLSKPYYWEAAHLECQIITFWWFSCLDARKLTVAFRSWRVATKWVELITT